MSTTNSILFKNKVTSSAGKNKGIPSNNIVEETAVLQKIELNKVKTQVELISVILPDYILNKPLFSEEKHKTFSGILVLAELSGLVDYCVTYNKSQNGGIFTMTATINSYVSILMDFIYFYEGDIINFDQNSFVALWKVENNEDSNVIVRNIISCLLELNNSLKKITLELSMSIDLKLAIAHGEIIFNTIGKDNKLYYVSGETYDEAKYILRKANWNQIVIHSKACNLLPLQDYHFEKNRDIIQINGIIYTAEEKNLHQRNYTILTNLCKKYLYVKNSLCDKKFEEIEELFEGIPPVSRKLQNNLFNRNIQLTSLYSQLKSYVIPPIYELIDSDESIQFLTGYHDVIIESIYVQFKKVNYSKHFDISDHLYTLISEEINNYSGVVTQIKFSSTHLIFFALFGLNTVKTLIHIPGVFTAATRISEKLEKLSEVETFSVSILQNNVFVGIFGSSIRKEFVVVSELFKKLHKPGSTYKKQIICDMYTYKKSNLPSYQFHVIDTKFKDLGQLYEYKNKCSNSLSKQEKILGRDMLFEVMDDIIKDPVKIGDYYAICFDGRPNIGKSMMLYQGYYKYNRLNYSVASIDLPEGPQRPYFCISHLYRQLYDAFTNLDVTKNNLLRELPYDVWNYMYDIQNKNKNKDYSLKQKAKVMNAMKNLILINKSVCIIFIDNIQFIDVQSLDLLGALLNERILRIFCSGSFNDEKAMDIKWKISLWDKIRILKLNGIPQDELPYLACQILNVQGIAKSLLRFMNAFCDGSPGLIKNCLLYFLKEGIIQKRSINVSTPFSKDFVILKDEFRQNDALDVQIALFLKDTINEENLSIQGMYIDQILSLSRNEQSVITVAAMIDSIFKRSLLIQVLDYPSESCIASIIKQLFDMEILDCGTKYLRGNNFQKMGNTCECFINEESIQKFNDDNGICYPKYAFCKLLNFKNKYIKKLVNTIVDKNEQDQLHLQILTALEEGNEICDYCKNNNLLDLYGFQRFKDFIRNFNEPHIIYATENECSDIFKQPDYIKDIIRKYIHKQQVQKSQMNFKEKENFILIPMKTIDPNYCLCFDNIIRTFTELIRCSDNSNHYGKKVYFTLQFAELLISLGEFNVALKLLEDAENLCSSDKFFNGKFVVSRNFQKKLLFKLRYTIGELHFTLANYDQTKKYILLCLQESRLPSIPSSKSFMNTFISSTILRKVTSINSKDREKKISFNEEVSGCLNLASKIFSLDNLSETAKLSSTLSLLLLTGKRANFKLFHHVYSNALQLNQQDGQVYFCNQIIEETNKKILTNINSWNMIDLYDSTMLHLRGFEIKILQGELYETIKMGYHLLDISNNLEIRTVFVETISIVMSTLIHMQRIQDAVEVAKTLFVFGQNLDSYVLIHYFIFALELYLETSFLLEPLEKCTKFAEEYFHGERQESYDIYEQKLLTLLSCHCLRKNQYIEAQKWKSICNKLTRASSFVSIYNLFKQTECLMILFAKRSLENKTFTSAKNEFRTKLKNCKAIARKWKFFLPRYLHFKAYYWQIRNQRRKVKGCLKDAKEEAFAQKNLLDYCWILQSENVWKSGYNFSSEMNGINWKFASTYTTVQWSNILYRLPWFT